MSIFVPLLLTCLDNNMSSWSCLGRAWSCLYDPNPNPNPRRLTLTLSTQHHIRQNTRNVHDTAEDDKRQQQTKNTKHKQRPYTTRKDYKTRKDNTHKMGDNKNGILLYFISNLRRFPR
jgi:hypothetical protein